jgi:hypothetical protein
VHGDQESRQHGRQGKLNHHDAVECRGGEHHDATQTGLDEAQARDRQPAELRAGRQDRFVFRFERLIHCFLLIALASRIRAVRLSPDPEARRR